MIPVHRSTPTKISPNFEFENPASSGKLRDSDAIPDVLVNSVDITVGRYDGEITEDLGFNVRVETIHFVEFSESEITEVRLIRKMISSRRNVP